MTKRPKTAFIEIEAAEPPALPTGELPSGKPQVIVIDGHRMVVMPEADYEVLIEAARDNIEDLAAATAAMETLRRIESGEEQTFPFDVVRRLARENRIKVLREHRGLTQAQLGEAVGSDRLYISQLETGNRRGSIDMLQKIAAVLDVPIDMVMPKPAAGGNSTHLYGLSERGRTYRAKPRATKPKSRKK